MNKLTAVFGYLKTHDSLRRGIFYSLITLSIGVIILFTHYSRLTDGYLMVDFLDIGQGDAVLISTPHNQHILVDGGPDAKVLDELGQVLPFLHKTIDLLVLTHPHEDHVGGLIEVVQRYQVKKVLLTGIIYDSPFYEVFISELKKQAIPMELSSSDHDFTIDQVFFDVLYPWQPLTNTKINDLNDSSLVIRLIYGQSEVMLPGDAGQDIENLLLKKDLKLTSDILKIGHHGSRHSTSSAFLKAVNPQYAVIQVGQDNRFSHPHQEVLEKLLKAGIKYFRNDWEGRIRIEMDKKGVVKVEEEA